MCVVVAPPPTLVRRALELEGAARRRARCLRGAAINAALLLALAADLSYKCPGYTSALHWVELCCAGVAGANLLRLALALARPAPPPLPLRPAQRRLLALTDPSLDSSFRVEETSRSGRSPADSAGSLSLSASSGGASASDDLSLSLSPARSRSWRSARASGTGGAASPPPSPAPSPDHSPEPRPRDRFIADRRSLAEYLQQYESRQQQQATALSPGGVRGAGGAVGAGVGTPAGTLAPAPRYQLAAGEAEGARAEEAEGAGADALAAAAAALRGHLDPTRLTEYNLNLRVWLHVTILERLVREIESVESALARLGLGGALAEWGAERLRALGAAPHAPPALRQLLPYVRPWGAAPGPRAAVLRRIRALAHGGALSEYRGASAPGAGAGAGEPTDAELLLHLFATYVDGQLPGPPERPFSSAFLSEAPSPPATPLALHRVSARGAGVAPHYVVCVEGAPLDVCRAPRSNLLLALLVFLAAAARLQPAPLRAPSLGRAALNLLWVIGR